MTLAPAAPTEYEDAEAEPASDTSRWPARSKSNPNGVAPAEADTIAGPARPPAPRTNVSIVLDALFVTTSADPSRVNATCAGPASPAASGRVEPASGTSPASSATKPLTLASPPAFST